MLELVKLDSATLPGIADAIRAKTGETALLLPSQMAEAIEGIRTGAELPELQTPAAESDVLKGKEYIDAAGEKRTGTLVDQIYEVETIMGTGGISLEVESTAGASEKFTFEEPNLQPENIKGGISIFNVAGSVKEIRTETGTITPAEDTVSLTIPEPHDGVEALVVIAADQTELETKGADSIYSFRAIIAHARNETTDIVGTLIRYNGKTYILQTTAMVANQTGEIYIVGSPGRYFRAGIVYHYYVYYWEDDA